MKDGKIAIVEEEAELIHLPGGQIPLGAGSRCMWRLTPVVVQTPWWVRLVVDQAPSAMYYVHI
jgi:hypothetical protein